MADNNVALRKRQQIENANRMMFTWVAVAAAVVGLSAVISVSLFQTMTFRQKVINEKNHTVATLKDNNAVVDELKEQVRVLNTNKALNDTPRLDDDSEPLSVVLDALPAQANSSAFGASLQQKLLDVGGISIDSLTVEPIEGVESGSESEDQTAGQVGEISFSFTVTAGQGNFNALKKVLTNLQKSIRAIDVRNLTIEQQNNTASLTVDGVAYYKSEIKVELEKTVVRP